MNEHRIGVPSKFVVIVAEVIICRLEARTSVQG
jgi:hypothetical protein